MHIFPFKSGLWVTNTMGSRLELSPWPHPLQLRDGEEGRCQCGGRGVPGGNTEVRSRGTHLQRVPTSDKSLLSQKDILDMSRVSEKKLLKKLMWSSSLYTCRSAVCGDIIGCRGDSVRLAIRVRVWVYPEDLCAVWCMLAVTYRSVL